MATVIVKRQTPTSATQDIPSLVPDEERFRANTYEAALLKLGEILLKDEEMTPWMSVRKISGVCLKHWKHLPQIDYSARTFSDWAGGYFSKCGEIRGKDLKVRYKTEPSSTRRDSEQLLQFVRVQARN